MPHLAPRPAPALERIPTSPRGMIPSDAQCRIWWDERGMFEHIKVHSQLVADVATSLAIMAADKGLELDLATGWDDFIQSVRAAGLLHDLGKTYSIQHGGNHSQLGAAWTLDLTRNPTIAQGVMHHVFWPGEQDPRRFFLPLAVIYADKRVMHDHLVSLEERFADLRARYGHSERSRNLIATSHAQGAELEHILSTFLREDLHAYFTDRWRLVR